jgi:asparagine synthase (glutamine-hydrolysing)
MCGITGFWQTTTARRDELTARVARMSDSLSHRGPDDEGQAVDESAGVALGFRRLAILDLSPTGHQPMTSRDGRFTIVFNGEIYNYRDLREALEREGSTFVGTSDTEVILEAARVWGVDGLWARLWGMWAIAMWDRRDRRLWLVRDRVGKKPLYYGRAGQTLLFGSELKALRAHPAFDRAISRGALAAYLRLGHLPGTLSIYDGIGKVPPGAALIFDGALSEPRVDRYWDPLAVVRRGMSARANGPNSGAPGGAAANSGAPVDGESLDQLDTLLRDAVRRRMIADVPLGAFLSGGIDSSAVVALMQAQSARPVKTFTIGFDTPGYNEAEVAKAVAAHLGTDHTELYVRPDDVRDVIPKLPWIFDEPFADSSQMPTYLVSQLARRHVTVALSGDGGDEVFGGYLRYTWARALWRRLGPVPRPARRAIGSAMRARSPEGWDAIYGQAEALLPKSWRQARPGEKLHKLARVVDSHSGDEMYERLASTGLEPSRLMTTSAVLPPEARGAALADTIPDLADRMMYLDLVGYLPDDILVKVDRASMSVSLESRAPLLDHRLIEWAWMLPQAEKLDGAAGKIILRRLVSRYVPAALLDRPKMGFSVPIDVWLRGALRPWAEELLDPARLRREGYFQPDAVRKIWDEHQSGGANRQHELWTVLMFQAWLDAQKSPGASPEASAGA